MEFAVGSGRVRRRKSSSSGAMTRRSSARTLRRQDSERAVQVVTGFHRIAAGQSGQGTYSQRPGRRRKRRYRSRAWLTHPGQRWRASALTMAFCALRLRPRIGVGDRAATGCPARTVPGALRGIGPSGWCHAAILACLFSSAGLDLPGGLTGESIAPHDYERQRTLMHPRMLVIFLNCAGYSNTVIALQARSRPPSPHQTVQQESAATALPRTDLSRPS